MNQAVDDDHLVLCERHDKYAVVTLNRPAKRNAMSRSAQAELCSILDDLHQDCRVVILTGAGKVSFCAGVDVTESRALAAPEAPVARLFAWESNPWFEVQERILRHPAIFIAAVNGAAMGGGLTLVNNAEIAIAAENATFGIPELGIRAFPGLSGPSTVHRIHHKRAAYMMLTTERIDATTAERWGLINEVVAPQDALLSRARELAARIAAFDPVLLDFTKRAIREIPRFDWSAAIDYGLRTGMIAKANRFQAPDDVAGQV